MTTKLINKLAIAAVAILMFSVVNATAQTYELRGATNRQLRTLINSIENRTDAYKAEMQRNTNFARTTSQEDRILDFIQKFEDATDRLKQQADSRRPIGPELTDVFNRAQTINAFMIRNRLSGRAESLWASVRNDLNTLATYYQYSWSWDQTVTTYPNTGFPGTVQTYELRGATSRQLRMLINRIENGTDAFKREMQRNSSFARTENQEERILDFIQKFEDSTDRLKQQADSRRPIGAELTDVFSRAQTINQFMIRNRLTGRSESLWASVRNDLNTLATYYQYNWSWDQTLPNTGGGYPGTGQGYPGRFARLTGTYRLNASRSDNVANIINTSLRNFDSNRRDNVRRNLERRLASPEIIAIDTNGRMVSMATSNSARAEFDADGVARTETNPRGRTVTTTATLDANRLEVNYTGDRMNDFYVTFAARGRDQLVVTKRLYIEDQEQTVSVTSVYDRISASPDWTIMNSRPNQVGGGPVIGPVGNGDFYVPNGTQISATLRSNVSTNATQIGDRFSMVVDSPGQYRGAIIEGRVAQAANSGRLAGRANISLEFDSISINGRRYQFAGVIDSVVAANGDTITVNNEGTIRDSNQTTQTVTRAGVGAVLGAIIGAIAGGGQGAAIGAGVGAGVGAGSVLITGRDTIDLGAGSRFNITAFAPGSARIGSN